MSYQCPGAAAEPVHLQRLKATGNVAVSFLAVDMVGRRVSAWADHVFTGPDAGLERRATSMWDGPEHRVMGEDGNSPRLIFDSIVVEGLLTLAVGADVVLVQNNTSGDGFKNGTKGRVISFRLADDMREEDDFTDTDTVRPGITGKMAQQYFPRIQGESRWPFV